MGAAGGHQNDGCTYVFLDEAGDLGFNNNGSRYFVLTAISMKRPFPVVDALDTYKHNCLEAFEHRLDQEFFHCTDDNRYVRKRVFDLIVTELHGIRIDCLVVEKRKTGPALREDKRFYPKMLGYLLKYVLPQVGEKVIIITDRIPVKKKRQAIEKGVKRTLAEMLPPEAKYRILHHESRSHLGLQVADYCCWAVFRKWERDDAAYYDRIKEAIKSNFDIFRTGTTHYY